MPLDDAVRHCMREAFPTETPAVVRLLRCRGTSRPSPPSSASAAPAGSSAGAEEQFWLLAALNHAFFDGLSSVAFLRLVLQLYTAVATLTEGCDPQNLVPECHHWPPPLLPAMPAPSATAGPPPAPPRPPPFLFHRRFHALQLPSPNQEPGPLPLHQRSTGFRRITLEGPAATALRRACRAQGTTVHGGLTAASCLAYRDCVTGAVPGAPGAVPGLELSLLQNVNLRDRAPAPGPGADHIGDWVGVADVTQSVAADSEPWAVAREAKAALSDAVGATSLEDLGALLSALLPRVTEDASRTNALDPATHGRRWTMSLSNLGPVVFEPATAGMPTALEVHGHMEQDLSGVDFWVRTQTMMPAGLMCIAISYMRPLIPEDTADTFAVQLEHWLRHMAATAMGDLG